MILQGDCRERMAEMEENSIDAIVCDPPYELGFMGKKWDGSGIAYDQEVWRQAWRVLKPGGYLLAFGGSRTEHRLACAIEDAGFEIRDSIIWTYGSGFPKSLNVSKSINGLIPSNLRCVCGGHSTETISDSQCDCLLSDDSYGGQPLLDQDTVRCSFPSQDDALGHNHDDLRKDDLAGEPEYIPGRSSTCPLSIEDCVLLLSRLREVSPGRDNILSCILESTLHASPTATHKMAGHKSYRFDLASDSASFGAYSRSPINGISRILHRCNRCNKYFALDGYGTALKPAIEIICMARKPLSEKTVAANVLRWGCGAVNVDGCRIGTETITQHGRNEKDGGGWKEHWHNELEAGKSWFGRWPANLILGHAPGCVRRGEDCVEGCAVRLIESQSEGASRFFYQVDGVKNNPYIPVLPTYTACQKPVESTPRDGSTKRTADGIANGEMLEAAESTKTLSINGSGNSQTVRCLWGTNSTILTTIKPTTICQICNLLRQNGIETTISELEKIIELLMVLNVEDVNGVKNTDHLSGLILDQPELTKDIAKNVTANTSGSGGPGTKSTALNTHVNIIKNIEPGSEDDHSAFLNIDPDPLFYCAKVSRAERNRGLEGMPTREAKTFEGLNSPEMRAARGRQAKETTRQNHHPTVKPLKLMRYLVRLVTPPGGVVLDPFAGSGTTLVAAKEEGFGYIGIELEPEYVEIAEARLAAAERPPATLEDFE